MASNNITRYSDIYNPEMLQKIVGEQWLNDPMVVRSGIVSRSAKPLQGTLTTDIRRKTFQDSSGQAVAAGDTISSNNRQEEGANSPVIWRYNSLTEPDVTEEISPKDILAENASLAAEIQKAASSYVDDSVISMCEGVNAGIGAANQYDYSATGTIALVAINTTMALALDKKDQLKGGGMVMHSKVYFDALALGLVAATSNTFGNKAQDEMVRRGELPETILGFTPIVTDKLALDGSDYRTFLVGQGALMLKGTEAPNIEVQRKQNAKATITLFDVSYGLGVDAMKWTVSGKENVTDTELLTASSWTLGTYANANDVAIYRLQTT